MWTVDAMTHPRRVVVNNFHMGRIRCNHLLTSIYGTVIMLPVNGTHGQSVSQYTEYQSTLQYM